MSKTVDIKALADYAVSEGTQNTEDGRWETSYEELYNHFGVEIERGDDACNELAQALRQRNEVRGLTITEDGIDVSYDTLFCKNLTLEGVSPMLERHPAILAYAVEMSRLADRYAKQAVDSQLDGIGRIRYYDMNSGAFRDHIDEELLLDMILDHPEIEEIESVQQASLQHILTAQHIHLTYIKKLWALTSLHGPAHVCRMHPICTC